MQILQRLMDELRYRPRILGRKYGYRGKQRAKQAATAVGNFVKHDLLWMRYGKQKPPRYLNAPLAPRHNGSNLVIVNLMQTPSGSWTVNSKMPTHMKRTNSKRLLPHNSARAASARSTRTERSQTPGPF